MKTNFKQEIMEVLKRNNKELGDVRCVNYGIDNCCTIEELLAAADFEYDAGYGSAVIDQKMVIIGDNWHLERREYDGSEWFKYCEVPAQNKTIKAIDRYSMFEKCYR